MYCSFKGSLYFALNCKNYLAIFYSHLCVNDLELPEDVVWVFIYGMKDDLVLSEIQGSSAWPIPMTLNPTSLSLFG